MPIRMTQDENHTSEDHHPGKDNRRGGGGGFSGGNLLFALLPFLLRNPKMLLLIGVLVVGYYLIGDGCNNALPLSNHHPLATGGVLDEKQFDKAEVYEPLATGSQNILPERVSLEKYAPTCMNQGEQGSCVGWSCAYAARTILRARETGENPNQIAFSPSFLYNQIKLNENCQGSYLIRAMEGLTRQGALPLRDFPYDDQTCSNMPNAHEKAAAGVFKMRGANRLTVGGDNYKIDLQAMKQNLAQGAPVVIGMMVGGSFMQEMMGRKVWIPTRNDYAMSGFGGHAMCVIGYDDFLEGGAFQIMNSWGKEWGENGIAWVRYKDFEYFAKEAYGTYPMGNAAAPKTNTLDLTVGLIDNSSKQAIALKTKNGNVFNTVQPIRVGQRFKMEVTNNLECYTYIFGQETDGSSYVLFPYTAKHSAFCGITGTRLFPKDYSMEADNKGNKDLIAVVVSKEPLNYQQFNKAINSTAGDYATKVNTALRNMQLTNVNFKAAGKINFKTELPVGKAVGLVIEMDKK